MREAAKAFHPPCGAHEYNSVKIREKEKYDKHKYSKYLQRGKEKKIRNS